METREIIEKILAHYEKCLKGLPLFRWRKYCVKQHVYCGVCNAIRKVVYSGYYDHYWIRRNYGVYFPYWCKTPSEASLRKEAKQLLSTRIAILKKELALCS